VVDTFLNVSYFSKIQFREPIFIDSLKFGHSKITQLPFSTILGLQPPTKTIMKILYTVCTIVCICFFGNAQEIQQIEVHPQNFEVLPSKNSGTVSKSLHPENRTKLSSANQMSHYVTTLLSQENNSGTRTTNTAGCDLLSDQWDTPAPTPSAFTFGPNDYVTGVPCPTLNTNPTDVLGLYERYTSANPGVDQIAGLQIGLGFLIDANDDMTFRIALYDDDGFGAPGVQVGATGVFSPTALGVPTTGFFQVYDISFTTPLIPSTPQYHVGVEIFAGDANDQLVVMSSANGQGQAAGLNHVQTSGFGLVNYLSFIGIDFDLHIIPFLADIENPVINCPGDIVGDTTLNPVTYTTPTATDDCTVNVTQSAGLPSGSTFPLGITTNTFVATDSSGNTDSCSFVVNLAFNCASIPTNIVYVDANATGANDGSSWADALTNLQDAIIAINDCPAIDTIFIAEGSYFPSVPAGRDATFDFSTDIRVYGGFSPANGAIDLATRDFRTYETILDGDLGILGDTSDNAYHVGRTISGSPIIDGLTIQNGNASNNGGGAMTLNGTLVTINNCNFRDNIGINGGAIATNDETIISNSIFTNNEALASGGAIEGAMFGNSLTIENSLFFENTVNGSGGAINLNIFASTSVFTLTNVTLSKNAATGLTGDAITYTSGGASNFTANITNSILWDNDDGDGNDNQIDNGSTTPTTNYTYSLIKGTDLTGSNGLDGTNLANDPQFTDPATNDFTLQPTSPAIDLGDNTAVTQPTDLNGDTRIQDGDGDTTATVDFGAFEAPAIVLSNIVLNATTGDLEFTDNDDRDDNLTIVIDGANYHFTDPDNTLTAGLGAIQIDPNTVEVLIASVTGTINIDTAGGDDTLTADLNGGNFIDFINYNGGTQISTAPGDILRLQGGGTFASVEHFFTNENDGSVDVAGNPVITYTGLEPIIDNLSVTDRVFTFTGVGETITLSDDGDIADNESFIDSTLGENVTFTNPTNSLTINTEISGGSGADVINIEGLDTNFDADVTVNGGADDDANFQTNPTSIGSGSYDINAQTIQVSQDVSTTLTGSISLNASQNIVADSGAVVSAENGDINFGANTAATLVGINTVAISVNNSATIRTTGTGNIVMNGVAVGDGSVSDRSGIVISNNSTVQTSGSGSISVTGTGGNGTSGNHGILLDSGSNVQSNSGAITITGTSGQGTDGNTGVYVNSEINTAGGDAIIMGTSIDAAGVDNAGIFVNANIGTNGAGNIDITGTSANAASDAITLFSFDRRITAFGSGTIDIAAVTGPLTGPAGIAPNPGPGPYSIAGFSTITFQGEIQAGNNVTGPGQLPILGFSNNVFSVGDELTLAINGVTTPGVDYSQLVATGMSVDITNTILNLVDGLAGPVPNGTTITLIENNGGPIVGTFNGLPNGATVPFNGQTFFINYNAGSGSNDVVLTENSLCAAFPANIVYVDVNATGSNDGTSWANAFTNLQDAITQINNCPALDTIYVAEGTYLPTTTTDRYTNFNIPGNTTVYGGFSPTNGAIDLGTRDFNAYPAILSGDIGVPASTADNVIHVVYITAIAAPIILDGLTIRDGFNDEGPGNPNFAQRSGAGLLIETYAGGANLTLNNCTFSNNASNYAAGALANTRQNHTINIDNSFFTNNGGGDIGSIFFRGDEVITITNTTISNNNGGNSTMYLLAPVNLTIDNCVFDNNGAQEYNALRVDGSGTSQISNSIFRNHNATINGALGLINANMIIENSLFHDNTAARGGAIYMVSSSLEIIGCTFTRNTASNNNFGEAIYVDNSAISTLNITNSIVWDNDDGDGIDDEISSDGAITGNFNHSLIKGFDLTASNGLDGTNPANDPLFTNPATNDFTVQTASPVIDLGDNTVVTEPNDLNGNTRIVDGDSNTTVIVDFGAYEAPELADTTPPVITCPGDIAEDCSMNPITYPFPTATDNIGITPATPTGFQFLGSRNGKTYFLSDNTFDGPSAFADAILRGGSVATVVDAETNALINQTVQAIASGTSVIIGLNDITTEGTFEWQSGQPVGYTNWSPGEPNDSGGEDYVQQFFNGFWNDISAALSQRYVLELTGGIEQTAGLSSGANFPVGTTTNTFVATDTSGNTDTCSFTVTVTDTNAPSITCPADIMNDCIFDPITYTVTASDNCANFPPLNVPPGFTALGTFQNKTYYLSDTAATADVAYTTATSLGATLATIEDATTNTFIRSAVDAQAGAILFYIGYDDATAESNFMWQSGSSSSYTNWNVGEPNGSTIENYTYVYADGTWNDSPVTTSVRYVIEYFGTFEQTAGLPSGSSFPNGTTINTFEATDFAGNIESCSFNVTINDAEDPVITCPADITGDCATNPITYAVTANDNCGYFPPLEPPAGFAFLGIFQNKTYYLSDTAETTADAFTNAIALGGTVATIEDAATNTYIRDAVTAAAGGIAITIGFNDVATEGDFEWQSGGPILYANWTPGEPNDFNTGEDYTSMLGNGLWNDVNDLTTLRYVVEFFGTFEQTAGLPSGATFPVGTTTNTFVATDYSGNSATCNFDVIITDSTPVTITCPGDITTDNDPGICGAYVNYPFPIPNEDCDQTNPLLLSQVDEIVNLGFDCVDFISNHVRIFDLATEGVTNDYFIDIVRVGIAFANPAENVTVNIYLDDQLPNAITTYNSPLSDHVPPYATNTVASPAINATILEVPINAFVPSDATVIVEVVTPETANFLMGYLNNNASETAVGYIGCGSFFVPSNLYPAIISIDGSEYLNQTTVQTAGLSPNSLFPIGTTTNTFVVTDGNGDTDTCSFDITVNDTELPQLDCPANIIVDNDASACGAIVDYTVYGSDNCIPSSMPGFEVIGSTNKKIYYLSDNKFLPPDAFTDAIAQGGFVVTIEDDFMNTFLFDRVQQMVPNSTPIIGYNDVATEGSFIWQSGDPALYNNWFAGEPNGDINQNHVRLRTDGFWEDISPTAVSYRYILEIDNTTALSQTAGLAAGSEFPVGTTTNTFTYTDPSGNIGSCSFDVTVNDIEAPTALCQDITIQLDATGNATIVATDVDGGSTDNCAVTDYQIDIDTFTCADVGNPVTVTLTVFDDALNSDTCTAIVTVEDVTAPTITCPGDQTEDFDANCTFTLPDYTGLATVSDACDATPTITQSPAPGTVISGNTVITLTATDASSNSDSCTFTVIPIDVTPPTITCPGDQTEDLDANCEFALPDYTGLATVSDTCDANPLVTQSPMAGTIITNTTTITIFAEDASGNINSCVFDVIPVDVTPPSIVCPGDQTEDFDANCTFTLPDYTGLATASDTCDPAPSVTQSPAPGTVISGNTVITLTATDASSNSDSCTFTVILVDVTPPTILCPGDQTEDLDANCAFILPDYTGLATVSDGCDANPVVTQSPIAGTIITNTTTVTLFAEDASGNINSCMFDVIPLDVTPPTITCPGDQTEDLDANCAFTLPDYTGLATASDTCDPAPSVTQSPVSGTVITANTVVTLTATDAAGNSDSCAFTVLLVDTTPPTAICQPFTAQLDATGTVVVTAANVDGGSTDNCSIASMSVSPNTFSCADVGDQTVTLTVTDAAGNISTCDAIVTVEDTVPPTAVCQDITVSLGEENSVTILPSQLDGGHSDNCSVASVTASPTTFTCDDLGPNTVTVIVTDVNGNTSMCTSIVTVTEDTPPMAICQPFTAQLDAFGTVTILPMDVDGGSTDNCTIDTLTLNQDTFTCDDIGENTVILTVTDTAGNSATCTTIVTVEDTVAPDAVCQDITVQLDAEGIATITAEDVNGGSSDACGIASLAIDINTFDCSNVGTNDVTLTVTDIHGNTNTCIAIVTVLEENAVPMAVCQNITVPLQPDGTAVIEASDINAGSTGQGCIDGVTIDIDTFDCSDIGTPVLVTLFITNGNGDVDTCTAFVNVVDTLDPMITCPDDQVIPGEEAPYTLPDYVALGEVFAEDNCVEIIDIVQTPPPGTVLEAGSYNINFVATDATGNDASCLFILTIEDIVLQIPEQDSLASLSVYPNPASNYINISNPNQLNLQTVQLFDVMGRLVKTFRVDGTQNQRLDISEIASATYFIIISTKNEEIIKQIIKE
jgi:Secretion system C-terminal sorting domain/HYR domain/Lectin C-type domain